MKMTGWVRFKVTFKVRDLLTKQGQLCFVLGFVSSQTALTFCSFMTHPWCYQRGGNSPFLTLLIWDSAVLDVGFGRTQLDWQNPKSPILSAGSLPCSEHASPHTSTWPHHSAASIKPPGLGLNLQVGVCRTKFREELVGAVRIQGTLKWSCFLEEQATTPQERDSQYCWIN